jgi:hypothetical protein
VRKPPGFRVPTRRGASGPASDPFPAVAEAAVRGRLRLVFEDIEQVLGVPVVNLVFRRLGTVPGALEWSWARLRPAYAAGAVERAAAALVGGLIQPRVPVLPLRRALPAV